MKYHYAKEKLGAAVFTLATGPQRIQNRLGYAFLAFHTLKETDFPEHLQKEWEFIQSSFVTEEPTYDDKGDITDGRMQNTLKTMDDDQCVELSKRIFELYSSLMQEA